MSFRNRPRSLLTIALYISLLAAASCVSVACGGGGGGGGSSGGGGGASVSNSTTHTGRIFGVTVSGKLITFSAASPGAIKASHAITGLKPQESLVAIDFRPANDQLYGIGSTSRLYKINASTGAATAVGSPFTPALNGAAFGADFDPVSDRMRVVSDLHQNLRINPFNGVATVDTPVAFDAADPNAAQAPAIVGLAYTNNIAGSSASTAYAIDSSLDVLVRVGGVDGTPSASSGQVFTTGPLNVNATTQAGFDVVQGSTTALMAVVAQGATTSQLRSVDLQTGATAVLGTIGGGEAIVDIASEPAEMFGITSTNKLVTFSSSAPGKLVSSVGVSGLPGGETIVGIDFRPASGQLYGVGSLSHLYVLDMVTGAATQVGANAFSTALDGTQFGVDFNPVTDMLRIVSDTGQNLQIDPISGESASIDADLHNDVSGPNSSAAPNIVGLAYTNDLSGMPVTTLYGVDASLDILVRQGGVDGNPSANLGELFTIGPLTVDASSVLGFDVGSNGVAYAAITAPAAMSSELFTIDLATGAASSFGKIGGNATIRDIAVPVPPAPKGFAVNVRGDLVSFELSSPGSISEVHMTGLMPGEALVGLDFRLKTHELYGVGNSNRVYKIDPDTGIATEVNATPFSPAMTGNFHGVDFNPVTDKIRVVSNSGQNLQLDPDLGTVASVNTSVVFAPGDVNAGKPRNIVSLGHTNNVQGATATTLYGIDSGLDVLVRVGGVNGVPSPDQGQLFTIGAFGAGIQTNEFAGFDIAPNGTAYATLTAPGDAFSNLYRINLATGAATLLGKIGGFDKIACFALSESDD